MAGLLHGVIGYWYAHLGVDISFRLLQVDEGLADGLAAIERTTSALRHNSPCPNLLRFNVLLDEANFSQTLAGRSN